MSKTIALFPAHPSQIWMLHSVQTELEKNDGIKVIWVMRDKDVSCDLADLLGIEYLLTSKASTGYVGNGVELIRNVFRCISITRRHKVDLWVTKYGAGNIAAKLCRKRSVSFNDDDVDQVPLIAATSYPFAEKVICPDVLRMNGYEHKAFRYKGCHELFYLHPNRFSPDSSVLKELGLESDQRYIVVRLSALNAHHDASIRGVSEAALEQVVSICNRHGTKLFITSEKPLAQNLEPYRLRLPVDRIHHALYFASVFLGDSQTMTSEAAILGTPAIRFSDFAGRLSVIDELERYGLAYGISPDRLDELELRLEDLLGGKGSELFSRNHNRFLNDKVDPVPFFADQVAECLG